jgi:carboxyl-terminal processing protease
MNRRLLGLSGIACCVIGAGCGSADEAVAPASSSAMSPAATAYLNSALDVMQTYSYYRKQIDWPSFRAKAIAQGEGLKARTTTETYPAIRSALTALGDHHSFFQPPASPTVFSRTAGASSAIASHPSDSLDGEMVGEKYGYIRIPTYAPLNGGTAAAGSAFADTIQSLIRLTDAKGPCAWVVDLRHNGGGNMWPMLAGVGPILGEGTGLGAFVDADGNKSVWYYADGAAGTVSPSGQIGVAAKTGRAAYKLRSAAPPVAVLTDGRTASSGEAITVAFRGRPGTRSFGANTFGVPTANAGHPLSDGGVIWLMSSLDVDRAGNVYIDPIPPDELIPTTANPATDDAVVTAALKWLATQPSCKS